MDAIYRTSSLLLARFILLLWPLASGSYCIAGETRTWTDNTGNHSIRAEYLKTEGDLVWLLRDDGQKISLSRDRLSEADLAWINELSHDDEPELKKFELPEKPLGKAWAFKTEGELFSLPIVDEQCVYFASLDNHFYCLDKLSGTLNWKIEHERIFSTDPTIYKGLVIFKDNADRFHALDRRTGKEKWNRKLSDSFFGRTLLMNDVLVVTTHRKVNFLNPQTGAIRKIVTTKGTGRAVACNSKVLVAVDVLDRYTEDFAGKANVVCVNAEEAKKRWSTPIGGSCLESIAVDENRCYVGARDGLFYALELIDGSVAWTIDCKQFFKPVDCPVWSDDHVLVVGDQVVFATGHQNISLPGALVAVGKQTGAYNWYVEHPQEISGQFVERDGVVYATTQDRNILAVDVESGETLATYHLPAGWRGEFRGITLDGHHLIVAGADYHVRRILIHDVLNAKAAEPDAE